MMYGRSPTEISEGGAVASAIGFASADCVWGGAWRMTLPVSSRMTTRSAMPSRVRSVSRGDTPRTRVARATRKRRCRVEKRMDGFRERATPGVTSICVSARNGNFPGACVPPFVARDRVRRLRTRLQPLLRLLLQTQVGLLDMWALEQALARAFQRDPPVSRT